MQIVGSTSGQRGLLARRLFPLGLAVGVLMSLGFPVTYYGHALRGLQQTATIYAQELAKQFEAILPEVPTPWAPQPLQVPLVLRNFLIQPHQNVKAVRVLDDAGRPVAGYGFAITGPEAWWTFAPPVVGTARIRSGRRMVGSVEAAISQEVLLSQAFSLFVLSAIGSIGLWMLANCFRVKGMRKEPAGAVQNAGPSARLAESEIKQAGGPVRLAPVPEYQRATVKHVSPVLQTAGVEEDVMAAFIPSRRLLFIDDDSLVRETLAHLLRNAGHTVEVADGGAAGLAILSQRSVDLVLTDLGMPGLNGWEVARAVKAHSPHLPVVLVTGWADTIAIEHQGRAFVDAILPKPCRFQEIQDVIGRLTGGAACAAVHCGTL